MDTETRLSPAQIQKLVESRHLLLRIFKRWTPPVAPPGAPQPLDDFQPLNAQPINPPAPHKPNKKGHETVDSNKACEALHDLLKEFGIVVRKQHQSESEHQDFEPEICQFDIAFVHPELPEIPYFAIEYKSGKFEKNARGQAAKYAYHLLSYHPKMEYAFCLLWNPFGFQIVRVTRSQDGAFTCDTSPFYDLSDSDNDIANWRKFFTFCTMEEASLMIEVNQRRLVQRKLLGNGGTSIVLGVEEEGRQIIAVKMIDQVKLSPVVAKKFFLTELKALETLKHLKGIRQLRESDESRLLLCFDLLDPIPENVDHVYWNEAIDNLKAAFDKGIVIRDLRISNILWDSQKPSLVFSDLGCACSVGSYSLISPHEMVRFEGSLVTASDGLLDSLIEDIGGVYDYQCKDDLESFVKLFFMTYRKIVFYNNQMQLENLEAIKAYWDELMKNNDLYAKAVGFARQLEYDDLKSCITKWCISH